MRPSLARLRHLAAWTVASVLLVACFRGVDWSGALAAAAGARPGWLAAAAAAYLAVVPLWAGQWWFFLPRRLPVAYPRVLRITAVMALTANSVPYLGGHAAGLHLLATRGGVGHAAALSVTTLDQLVEGLAKVTLLLALALVAPLPQPLRAALLALAPAVGLLLALTWVGAWRGGALRRATARLRGRLAAAGRFVVRWSEALEGARRPGVLAAGFLLALGIKAVEVGGMVAVQTALGVHVPLAATLVVLASVALATMVPVAPGNLGVYEASAFFAYRWAGVDAEAALALAVLQHLAQLAAMGGAGWAALSFRGAATPAESAGGASGTAVPAEGSGGQSAS